jgi:hypothetical protein
VLALLPNFGRFFLSFKVVVNRDGLFGVNS